MEKKRIIQVEDKLPLTQLVPLSIQHVFAMFGASVLVPILFGVSSGIVLFMNGVGTLLFIFLTKGKAPVLLSWRPRVLSLRKRALSMHRAALW